MGPTGQFPFFMCHVWRNMDPADRAHHNPLPEACDGTQSGRHFGAIPGATSRRGITGEISVDAAKIGTLEPKEARGVDVVASRRAHDPCMDVVERALREID